jgi:asparaginyl-tRNA synthetase
VKAITEHKSIGLEYRKALAKLHGLQVIAARDQLSAVSRIHRAALDGVNEHYERMGILRLTVPVLVGITGACENVSTLFQVEGHPRIHLTQTGQLALEQALQFAEGVCCITPSFRTDSIDSRHLNEFTLIEQETSYTHPIINMNPYDPSAMFECLLDHITAAVREACYRVFREAAGPVQAVGGKPDQMAELLAEQFARITYTEAVELLRSNGCPKLQWGDDLTARHEAQVLDLVAVRDGRNPRPTFVTHYPAKIKFFNMRLDDVDNECVQSVDLLLPYAGEAAGGAVREHDYGRLIDRLTGSTMFAHLVERGLGSLQDFRPYLNLIRDGGTSAHAGYGIGLERLIQFIIRSADIRDCSTTYMLSRMAGFDRELSAAQTGSHSPGF